MISSASFMSHQPVIDGFEFASAGASLQGSWSLGEFPRLRDMLASPAGEVKYRIDGVRDAQQRASLRLQVEGVLMLPCQRCLEAVPVPVRADELLVLAGSQAEIDAEPVDVHAADRVLAGKQMPVRDLVEDELILALPYAPRHEGCRAGPSNDGEGRKSPFAGLRGLVGGKS